MDTANKAISVIFLPGEENTADQNTLKRLKKQAQSGDMQIILPDPAIEDRADAYNHALKQAEGKWVTVVEGGDRFSKSYFEQMLNGIARLSSNNSVEIWMSGRDFLPFSQLKSRVFEDNHVKSDCVLSLDKDYKTLPVFMNGVFVLTETAKKFPMDPAMGLDAEKDMLLRILLEHRRIGYLPTLTYGYSRTQDIHFDFYPGVFDLAWYRPSVQQFLLPLLENTQKKYGEIPQFLQSFCIYYIRCRLEANSDNRNKHLLEGEELDAYLDELHQVLSYVSDVVLLNIPDVKICWGGPNMHMMLLQLKRNDWQLRYRPYLFKTLLFGVDDKIAYSKNNMRVRIEFIDYRDGKWEIDGSIPALFSLDDVQPFVCRDDVEFELQYNERYSLTKYFGVAAFKRYTFHVSIPLLPNAKEQSIHFFLRVGETVYSLSPEYTSHFSRLSGKLKHQYWRFDKFIAFHAGDRIRIRRAGALYQAYRELRIWQELLFSSPLKTNILVLLLRMLYFITRPWYKNKRIWLFYDKIYKGGDSSEYLFHYARKQKDGIQKYYLLDPSCPDWKRAKREGFRPLRRGSIRHRLIFLNADMVICSNSTVYNFNGYSMNLSSYIRGIPDFHVVCVQHGMSVQKIAIAQNRLRDNTRLYFCASPYEIQNLSHPVYDYNGYDALKLTGVPRYDGLIDDDKKQILISPTWRMQAARLVKKSESVQRDYNPLFKESPYFRVYNSLINDQRLIDAAKKYGYTIAYVLHPIVSPQAEDFDKNDFVKIIPSTGDMSYEKMFRESSLMVSDYSGVQFDFAYMRKPLVYLHHDDIPQHYEEGTFHYDTMAFGEICHNNDELIDLLCDYMKNGCKMKPEYRRRADDFFAFDDHNNCQRIYDVMLDYQKTRIDPQHHAK